MGNPILTYTLQPASVFVATTVNMNVVIENPITGTAIEFAGGPQGDEIQILIPVGSSETDLVEDLNFTATSLTPGFTIGLSAGNFFSINSPVGTTLQPGATIQIKIENMVINGQTAVPPSQAGIIISEYIGANEGNITAQVDKLPAELNVIGWVAPTVVGLYQEATLFWQSMGGIGVEISGFPTGTGKQDFPVSGDPPYADNTQVTVGSTIESQRTYTLKVYTSDQKHVEVPVTLSQNPPIINFFKGDKSGTIAVNEPVTLSWDTLFAASSSLSTPLATFQSPNSPKTVNPGTEQAKAYFGNYSAMRNPIEYTLEVQGFQGSKKATYSINLATVGLAFFKYLAMDEAGNLSKISWQTDPAGWAALQVDLVADNNKLTLWQPDGSEVEYYLGDLDTTHPQIQYFNGTDAGSGSFELQWVTKNLSTLVLNPGNYQLEDVAAGTKTLQAAAGTVYTLTGTTETGQTIQSILTLVADA